MGLGCARRWPILRSPSDFWFPEGEWALPEGRVLLALCPFEELLVV